MKQTRRAGRTNRKQWFGWVALIGSVALVSGGAAYTVTHHQEVLDGIRQLNKRYTNRIALAFAGREHSHYAVLRHQGRKTGKEYETPVVAEPTATGFVIPLPYGMNTDWCRNVRAARQARLVFQGRIYTLTEPEIVNVAVVAPILTPTAEKIFHLLGIKEFLRMRGALEETVAAREGEAEESIT